MYFIYYVIYFRADHADSWAEDLRMFGLRTMFFVVQDLVQLFGLLKYGLCLWQQMLARGLGTWRMFEHDNKSIEYIRTCCSAKWGGHGWSIAFQVFSNFIFVKLYNSTILINTLHYCILLPHEECK